MNPINISQKYKRMVEYLWDPEPKNDDYLTETIWCLGEEYKASSKQQVESDEPLNQRRHSNGVAPDSVSTRSEVILVQSPDAADNSKPIHGGWPAAFLDDFESRIWITYRSNFPAIPKSKDSNAQQALTLSVRLRSQLLDAFTSDTGWGCMIRSGQSLLANALSMLSLGRDWRRDSRITDESALLSLFADDPKAPFSIHRFVEHGASACGKYPGEWFGPSATAQCIEALCSQYNQAGLRVYFTSEGPDVHEDKFCKVAGPEIQPTLILLGVRLGIESINSVYWEALKALVKYPQSVGIAGGRPSSSLYFVGVQGPYFFYLDPHHTRLALQFTPDSTLSEESLGTYHTRRLRRLHIKEMDPSMLIGFLIKDREDWEDWKRRIKSTLGKPIIHLFDSGPPNFGRPIERVEALEEVEALTDEEADAEGDSNWEITDSKTSTPV